MNRQQFDYRFFKQNEKKSMSSGAGFTNYGWVAPDTTTLIKGNKMEISIPTAKLRQYIIEFYKDFKAGFLPMFLYLTGIILLIVLLNFAFSSNVALGILFGGVGIYLTAMLGGLKRLRGQDTVFEKGWDTINTIDEDDPNVSQR